MLSIALLHLTCSWICTSLNKLECLLDLSKIDLLRIRRSQADTLSRWLNDDHALFEFEAAILSRLANYQLWQSDMVAQIYLFGREMRQVFENRANPRLQFKIKAEQLQSHAYLVFLAGFVRADIGLASEIGAAPKSRFPKLLERLLSGRN
jgi:hypothetical protein